MSICETCLGAGQVEFKAKCLCATCVGTGERPLIPEGVGVGAKPPSVVLVPLVRLDSQHELEGVVLMSEEIALHPKVVATGKLRAFADRYLDLNHDGKADLGDAKLGTRVAWRVILFFAKYLPDHTVIGKAADRVVAEVDRAGLRGEADGL